MKCLERGLARLAIKRGERKYYLEKTNFGKGVWRVSNIAMTKAWYGVNYTKNESSETLTEMFNPKLKGIEIVGRNVVAG
jgi:fibrillarin-like rRNA methylase